jgi:rhamnulokinase
MKYLAFDLGANSGRAMLMKLDDKKMSIEEILRFDNDPIIEDGLLSWNVHALFSCILEGIKACVEQGHDDIESLAIDTWGVDVALLDDHGELIAAPAHYRNHLNTVENMNAFFEKIGLEELYRITGIQHMPINTVFQINNLKTFDQRIDQTKKIVFIPDLFNYWLTGMLRSEYTIASTSAMLDIKNRAWSERILDVLGLKQNQFAELAEPGMLVGYLKEEIADRCGIKRIPVIHVASHDTASAVAGVPFEGQHESFLSCGTWSLLGKERGEHLATDAARLENFTNEAGVHHTTRFLKNIGGLWILQELVSEWQKKGRFDSYDALEQEAMQSTSVNAWIDPDYEPFQKPGNMEAKLVEYLKQTNQNIPASIGQWTLLVYESLAKSYNDKLTALDRLTGETTKTIWLVGGGSKSRLLSQFTADYTSRTVIVGQNEATAIGNTIVQSLHDQAIESLQEGRKIVRASWDYQIYLPKV